ncbi:MAG: phosphohydrolase, partial [Sulfurimonas sp. CG07_land_8_20_14_0_80_36_56]
LYRSSKESQKNRVCKFRQLKELFLEVPLSDYEHTTILKNITSYHHERMNGEGYPHKLKGSQIPMESKIVAVADVFDAMSNPRPYHKGHSIEETFEHLQSNIGTLFDSDCVNALVERKEEVSEIRKIFVSKEYNFKYP